MCYFYEVADILKIYIMPWEALRILQLNRHAIKLHNKCLSPLSSPINSTTSNNFLLMCGMNLKFGIFNNNKRQQKAEQV